jgi:hypothetical protein
MFEPGDNVDVSDDRMSEESLRRTLTLSALHK